MSGFNKVVLSEDYDTYQYERQRIAQDVRYEFKQKIKDEIAERTQSLDDEFGRKLAHAIDGGMTRKDLSEITRSNDGTRIRRFYEMAGRKNPIGRPRKLASAPEGISVEDFETHLLLVTQLPEADHYPEGFTVYMDHQGDSWAPRLAELSAEDRNYILADGKGSIRVRALIDFASAQGW